MTESEQLRAIAELEGWTFTTFAPNVWCEATSHDGRSFRWFNQEEFEGFCRRAKIGDYLTSRDAVVPVIEKQTKETIFKVCEFFQVTSSERVWVIAILLAPPNCLCEALLRATGKWKE